MSNILDYLNTISEAVYGRDVRQAIVDAISVCYQDGKAGVNDLTARTLIEQVIAVNEDQEAEIDGILARVIELEGGGSSSGTTDTTTTTVNTAIIDSGTVASVSVANNATVTRDVTFTETFSSAPSVFVCIAVQNSASNVYSKVQVGLVKSQLTTTGFRFFIANTSGAQRSVTVDWMAVEPTTQTIETDITVPATDDLTAEQIAALIALLDGEEETA